MIALSEGIILAVFFLLITAVSSFHVDLKGGRSVSWLSPSLSVCTSKSDVVLQGAICDTKSSIFEPSEKEIYDKERIKRIESVRDRVDKYLTSEAEFFGTVNWNIEHITDTAENICFKCTPLGLDAKPVFVKCSQQPRSEAHNSLRYEFEGMRVFSKYSPKEVPRVLLYDDEKRILVSEWLDQYLPLSHFFGFTPSLVRTAGAAKAGATTLEVDSDTCRAMGTIMGRSHARTHRRILTSDKYSELLNRFSNYGSISLWEDSLFSDTLRRLNSPPRDAVSELLALYNGFDTQNNGKKNHEKVPDEPNSSPYDSAGPLTLAVQMLRKTFLYKKDSLLHADLHSNNVMMLVDEGKEDDPSQRSGDRRSRAFKVIDFAKCCMGPPGLDLGMFLANFLWYHAGHSEPSRRRGAVSGVMSAIDSYKSAFRVQLGGTGGTGGAARDLQRQRQIQFQEKEAKEAKEAKQLREQPASTVDGGEADTPQQQDAKPIDVDDILNETLRDAMGFMGLYSLFMALDAHPDISSSIDKNGDNGNAYGRGRDSDTNSDSESFSSTARSNDSDAVRTGDLDAARTSARGRVEPLILGDMPEMLWGDTRSRSAFVRQRQVEMSVMALFTYLDSTLSSQCDEISENGGNDSADGEKSRKKSSIVTAQSFASIFLADDKVVASNHMTEFWY